MSFKMRAERTSCARHITLDWIGLDTLALHCTRLTYTTAPPRRFENWECTGTHELSSVNVFRVPGIHHTTDRARLRKVARSLKPNKKRSRLDLRQHFLHWIIDIWKYRLDNDTVYMSFIHSFIFVYCTSWHNATADRQRSKKGRQNYLYVAVSSN